ncbi:efflux RND transporter periplasmic adaptor subunit [Elongatibacter sediminis]|uniref:Efflux RND transporter periplasmic adaptor subunit n=1 Tax=Elongatibacter sediminis TaxID=3119006 RepID=A0AAW9RIR2_9GAMM
MNDANHTTGSAPRETADPSSSLADILSQPRQRRGISSLRWIIPVLVVLAVAAVLLMGGRGENGTSRFLTTAATRDSLQVSITATGNLEPTNQVDVGSELSGTVRKVFVDDDDRVTQGQVLAELDLSTLEDSVARSQAALAVAEANVKQAEATVLETTAQLERFREVARLSDNKVPSRLEMETAEANQARAEANLANAQASVEQARAVLHSEEVILSKGSIRSPIDGIVLERAVDPGQAVAASLQAVTLFSLAEDLSEMELQVDIDEADVGQVRAGLNAEFTVDAWPDRRFEAVITRVGYNATDSDGVISYPAILKVNNSDLNLRPGMTGTAVITTLSRDDVLLVPNAALRFTPRANTEDAPTNGGLLSALMPRPPRGRNSNPASGSETRSGSRVWLLEDGQPRPVPVELGASDGRLTEVVSGALKAGDLVITGVAES